MQNNARHCRTSTLKKRRDFLTVRKYGRFHVSHSMILESMKRKESFTENGTNIFVGYTATKKIGKAVIRNRAKRRLRSLVQSVLTKNALHNRSYVLIAKKNILTEKFSDLEAELLNCLKSLRACRHYPRINTTPRQSFTT